MSRFLMRSMAATAVVALTVSFAAAQERGQGGRRGGFSGFGGGGAAGLLRIEEVQKELGLSAEAVEKLQTEIRALYPERQGNREDFQNFQNLSEEERTKRMAEFRKQMDEMAKKTDAKLKESLTEAQYKRLGELRIQREGASSLSRAEIAEKLKLTDEQKEKIAKIQEEARPQFGGGRRGDGGGNQGERPNFNPEEFRAKMEKTNADIVAVLTEEQKIAWEGMKGKKFDFPAPNFGQGGGRRGRGNRPAAE